MAQRVEILLVEDTPSDVRLTQEALKDSNLDYNLTVVNDGEQAMEYFKKTVGSAQQPHLVLLDLNMPKKNGHEVLSEMKQIDALKDVPVILLTVSRDEEEIMKALNLKMNYYLGKPVTSDQLNTLLQAINELHSDAAIKKTLNSEDAHIRYVLAGNPHTHPSVLSKLSKEQNATIRGRVAENPQASIEILNALAADAEPEVRQCVVDNPSAPQSLLDKLSRDEHDDVRLAVASNPSIPANILKQLSGDENPHVAAAAQASITKTTA